MAKGRKSRLTDEQVEEEIARLNGSEAVALARKYRRIAYRRRQYLYSLRDLERLGLRLMSLGITEDEVETYYRIVEGGGMDAT
jgi:hypothetical protein